MKNPQKESINYVMWLYIAKFSLHYHSNYATLNVEKIQEHLVVYHLALLAQCQVGMVSRVPHNTVITAIHTRLLYYILTIITTSLSCVQYSCELSL